GGRHRLPRPMSGGTTHSSRLRCDGGYSIEVRIIVQQSETIPFRDGRNEEIRNSVPPVLCILGEHMLHFDRALPINFLRYQGKRISPSVGHVACHAQRHYESSRGILFQRAPTELYLNLFHALLSSNIEGLPPCLCPHLLQLLRILRAHVSKE